MADTNLITAPPETITPHDGGDCPRYMAAWGFCPNIGCILGPELAVHPIEQLPVLVSDLQSIMELIRDQFTRQIKFGFRDDAAFRPDEEFRHWRNSVDLLRNEAWPLTISRWSNLIHIRTISPVSETGFYAGECVRHIYLDSGYAPKSYDEMAIYLDELAMLLKHHHDEDDLLFGDGDDEFVTTLFLREQKSGV